MIVDALLCLHSFIHRKRIESVVQAIEKRNDAADFLIELCGHFSQRAPEVSQCGNEGWGELVARMIDSYATALFNPNWGEQIAFSPGLRMSVSMVCHSLSQQDVEGTWAPFIDWLKSRPQSFKFTTSALAVSIPGCGFWDPVMLSKMPGIVLEDSRPGAPATNIFWRSNLSEAGQVLHAYQSAWLPSRLLAPVGRSQIVDALIRSSAIWTVGLHTDKGLTGGSPEAIEATRQTAMNPEMLDAFALLICAAEEQPAYPGIPGREPDLAGGRRDAAAVRAAMREIYAVAPRAGAYVSESDCFSPNGSEPIG